MWQLLLLLFAGVLALCSIGFVYYRITYVNAKGDISHSEGGVILYTYNAEDDTDQAYCEKLAQKHSRDGDVNYRFRIYPMKPRKGNYDEYEDACEEEE